MTPAERVKYFRDYWPAACAVRGWNRRDDMLRRKVVLDCMAAVHGPLVTTSDPQFRRDETTALFCLLDHLAHPEDLGRAARWTDCMADYRAYNRARQADWHEGKAYGAAGSKKLRRDRFAGRQSATGGPLDPFDPEAIRKRHITMASRHRKKQRSARADATGQDVASHAPAAQQRDTAYVPPADQPF